MARRRQLSETAPAKINLALHVLGRRPDGFHELDSLFLPLALADEVAIELELEDSAVDPRTVDGGAAVACTCPGHPELDGPSNLAARAATAYFARAGRRAVARLTVHKRIWTAAGMGGGSSDAGAVLRSLQRELRALSPAALGELAFSLGADVPFFLESRPARARGRGELLTPIAGIPALALVLLNPGLPLATGRVYQALGLRPGERGSGSPLDLSPVRLSHPESLVHNDLQGPATRILPQIDGMIEALQGVGATVAALTGSGPTVFGLFPEPRQARAAADYLLRTTSFSVICTETLSP